MDCHAVHLYWMRKALRIAEQAMQRNEVPVGAILVREGEQLGAAMNQSVQTGDPTAHAEWLVLSQVARKTNPYDLRDTTLYVTLEPCLMCLGAIIHCQIRRLIFGAYDPKRGAAGSSMDILPLPGVEFQPDVLGGVLEDESAFLLRNFFKMKRGKKNESEIS